MDYRTDEQSGILVPMDFIPAKEYFRVMDKTTMKIVCVDKIDPDATLHPAGGRWEPDGVHKGLPFVKGCGCHALNELTKKEREDIEIVETAPERRAIKESKRAEKKAEQDEREAFDKTPVGERTAIIDTKMEEFVPDVTEINSENVSSTIGNAIDSLKEIEQAQAEITEIKRRGRPAKK